jgi:hypothetical protein
VQHPNGTIVVYLLSVGYANEGALITLAPYTFKDAPTDKPLTLKFPLTMCAYDLPARSRFAMVVTAKDVLFLDQNEANQKLRFLSGSILSIPIHVSND